MLNFHFVYVILVMVCASAFARVCVCVCMYGMLCVWCAFEWIQYLVFRMCEWICVYSCKFMSIYSIQCHIHNICNIYYMTQYYCTIYTVCAFWFAILNRIVRVCLCVYYTMYKYISVYVYLHYICPRIFSLIVCVFSQKQTSPKR